MTPFRGRNTSAPDLLQLRSINRPLRTHKDRLKDCMMDRLRSSGRHLVMRCRPELPSGRQDLNLRPLDPQRRPATPPTCENSRSAGRGGAVQLGSVPLRSAQRIRVLQVCSRATVNDHAAAARSPYVEVVELWRGVTQLRQPFLTAQAHAILAVDFAHVDSRRRRW